MISHVVHSSPKLDVCLFKAANEEFTSAKGRFPINKALLYNNIKIQTVTKLKDTAAETKPPSSIV